MLVGSSGKQTGVRSARDLLGVVLVKNKREGCRPDTCERRAGGGGAGKGGGHL